jgi:hypothetical protein
MFSPEFIKFFMEARREIKKSQKKRRSKMMNTALHELFLKLQKERETWKGRAFISDNDLRTLCFVRPSSYQNRTSIIITLVIFFLVTNVLSLSGTNKSYDLGCSKF